MAGLGVCLAYAQAKGKAIVELGVSQVEGARAIEAVHELLVDGVSAFVAEADEIQGRGGGEFEAVVPAHPESELLRKRDVLTDVMLQALDPVVAEYEP